MKKAAHISLFEIMDKNNISVTQMADILDIPRDRIYSWRSKNASPKTEDSKKIESWINSNNGINADLIPETMMNEDGADYQKQYANVNGLTILNMSESEKTRARAEELNAQARNKEAENNSRLISLLEKQINSSADLSSFADLNARLWALQAVLEDVAGGKKYQSSEEARADIRRRKDENQVKVKEGGNLAGRGK